MSSHATALPCSSCLFVQQWSSTRTMARRYRIVPYHYDGYHKNIFTPPLLWFYMCDVTWTGPFHSLIGSASFVNERVHAAPPEHARDAQWWFLPSFKSWFTHFHFPHKCLAVTFLVERQHTSIPFSISGIWSGWTIFLPLLHDWATQYCWVWSRGFIRADKSPARGFAQQRRPDFEMNLCPWRSTGSMFLLLSVSASYGSGRTYRIVILPEQRGCFFVSVILDDHHDEQ